MTGNFGGAAIVAERYQVEPEKPLPNLDTGSSKAYAVTDLRDTAGDLYALLPDRELPLRITAVSKLRRINNNHFLRPLAWDAVGWPLEGGRRPAIVFERPRGAPLFETPKSRIEPLREEALVRRFLQPMVSVLEDLSYSAVVHRAIRAENLFLDGSDPERSAIMLGECVSAPPGYHQPCVYETIECAMADPAGRGEGSSANDFYALGVTAGFLLMGRNPFAGMDERQIINLKLSSGKCSNSDTHDRGVPGIAER
jgi:serine/threonine protein kinase